MTGTASLPIAGPPRVAFEATDLARITRHMYALMLRNVASDGFRFRDSNGAFSQAGCVIASPSYPANDADIDQDYVFHWVRDGAITMMEIAAAPEADLAPLVDYVAFSKTCQDHAEPTLAHACFTVDGWSRPWTEQSDGPAIQTLAMLGFFARLDAATQAVARGVMQTNVDWLVAHYAEPTRNLWEEVDGFSFFTRSVQLACLRAVKANAAGLTLPAGLEPAIEDLAGWLDTHWNEAGGYYVSVLPMPDPVPDGKVSPRAGYDVNIDIVCAALYGAVRVTDTKLLASAAKLRAQWADAGSPAFYPINGADAAQGVGPLLGRYPGDVYDGDTRHPVPGGHPWALCSANLAELYYRVANATLRDDRLPLYDRSRPFFAQLGIADQATATTGADALREAGDKVLRAILYHSDHLELSEQFDGTTGYEKSVRNLTWSYAAFLSALRARAGDIV